MTPQIIVLSGPGGVGKNAILDRLVALGIPKLTTITKWTTRSIRPGEVPGKEFEYLTVDEFQDRVKKGELIEHNFFNGNYYGVPKAPVEKALQKGESPVLVVDVNGARAIKQAYPNQSLLIFITAPIDQLRERYMARGQTPEEAEARIQIAQTKELPEQVWYDAVVENLDGQIDQAVEKIVNLIQTR